MKIQLGKSRKFIVDGKMIRCMPTSRESTSGIHKWYLREVLPPHNSFWYDTKLKKKLP